MKNFLSVLTFITLNLTFSISHAFECADLKLVCHSTRVNSDGRMMVGPTASALFVAENNNEPSLPAISCVAQLNMPTLNPNNSFTAHVIGHQFFMGHFYVSNKAGVVNQQFSTQLTENQKVELTYGQDHFDCSLVSIN